jgi:DNA primase
VGYTARAVDDDPNKYLNFMPENFLFNSRVLDIPEREFALLIEGPTDALAVDGVSPLGAKLNERQTIWLKNSGKRVIVVPDRDKQGQTMIDIARRNNWAVAFPGLTSHTQTWWDDDVKDCDAAVKRHGRLYTLKSILETATNNGTEIEVKRRYL